MSDTPKKRADLDYVKNALRAGQEGREDAALAAAIGEDEEEEEELDEERARDALPERDLGPDGRPFQPAPVDRKTDVAAQKLEFGVPEWFRMPENGFPADVTPGTVVTFLKFPVWVTGNAKQGERQCAARPLTTKLERFARAKAANGNGYDLVEEYTKAMLCVIDGTQADFFRGRAGSVNHFWAEIGPKARELLIAIYNKSHRLSAEERTLFLESCVTTRTVG
jgi:hypothetical protein